MNHPALRSKQDPGSRAFGPHHPGETQPGPQRFQTKDVRRMRRIRVRSWVRQGHFVQQKHQVVVGLVREECFCIGRWTHVTHLALDLL